jgi:hypothetical protein
MIEFKQILCEDKAEYEKCLFEESDYGCEASFANLFMWGRQKLAFLNGQALVFSQFNRQSVYPYPVGRGDKRASIDAIISDAEERGIPCRITGLNAKAVAEIEEFYPGKFHFHCARNSFDYVYSTSMAGIRDTMRGIISQKNAPVASSAKSWERQVQSAIRSQEKAFDRLLNSGN